MTVHPTIMKFGGTSVEDSRAFERVGQIVRERLDEHPVVVVSAMSRFTDALLSSVSRAADGDPGSAIQIVQEHLKRHTSVAEDLLSASEAGAIQSMIEGARSAIADLLRVIAAHPVTRPPLQDEILSFGERLSAGLLAAALRAAGVRGANVDVRQCVITDENHGCASLLMEESQSHTRDALEPLIAGGEVPVLGGFVGATQTGATTTLGRGGSDFTASIVGAALEAREIQIWTDVAGVLTADPRIVSGAQTVARLSYDEAAELAYFGAKVLHPKTIQPAVAGNIPVRICNSRAPEEPGTIVCAETESVPHTVKAIAHKIGVTIVQITSARMLDTHGFLRALFKVFDRYRTSIDVVSTSEVSVSLTIDDATALDSIVRELEELGTVSVEQDRAIICVVGEGLRGTPGIASRVFGTISDINVSMISQGASSINLTFVVGASHAAEVVRRLHRSFFEQPMAADAARQPATTRATA